MYINIYIYTFIHIYIYTYIHTYILFCIYTPIKMYVAEKQTSHHIVGEEKIAIGKHALVK